MEFSKEDPSSSIPKIKVVIVGDTGVGKSSIVQRFNNGTFSKQGSTLGVDTRVKTVECDGVKIKLEIWDTAGQEKYRSMIRSFFKNAKAVILVFDLTSKQSLDTLGDWLKEVDNDSSSGVTKIILANKADLTTERISSDIVGFAIQTLTKTYSNIIGYMEVSALTGENINESFQTLAQELIANPGLNQVERTPSPGKILQPPEENLDKKEAKGCKCG